MNHHVALACMLVLIPNKYNPSVTSRVFDACFGRAARRKTSPSHGRPLGIRASFRVPTRRSTALLVQRSHFAVGRSLGSVVFLHRAAPGTVKRPVRPLYEFRVPPESCPAQPSRPAAADQLLSWASVPYSTRGFGGPLAAGLAIARYVPPAGFGHPLGGLLPPSPCRPCFVPAALLGFALRSFLLTEGIRHVSGRKHPHAVSPVGFSRREAVGRPNGPRPLGFAPSGSPSRSPHD
jgi:hypothetical protein